MGDEAFRILSVHTLTKHVAHLHVSDGNAEYVEDKTINRAVGVEGSDSETKKRKKK